MPTTNSRIILTGTPFAWIYKTEVLEAGGQKYSSATILWRFDNLQSSTYKILKPGTEAGKGENIDITRADGLIFRFPKEVKILSGVTENDITPADSSSDLTSKGEITLVTNEAHMGTASTWTNLIAGIKENYGLKFLVIIGTGYAFSQLNNRQPDGFVLMLGKLTNDIEQQLSNNPTSLTLTFASCSAARLNSETLSALNSGRSSLAIPIKGYNQNVIFPELTADVANSVFDGDIVVLPA